MFNKIYDAIVASQSDGIVHEHPSDILTGFSGKQLIGAIQRLTALFKNDPIACYLEIGVFQGLTLLSTAFANRSVPCYGIDNFAFLDREGKNKGIVEQRMTALKLNNATLIDSDYEDALNDLGSRIDSHRIAVYFVDGPHDYRSQRVCLDLAVPHLHDHAIIVVDDSNYPHVRQANNDFLVCNPEFKLIFEAYTPNHPLNLDDKRQQEARAGWWNGVNIITKDSENQLPPLYPQTIRNRSLYEDEHKLHSSLLAHELGPLVDQCVTYINASTLNKPKRAFALLHFLNQIGRSTTPNSFVWGNTWSGNLPATNFNPGLISSWPDDKI